MIEDIVSKFQSYRNRLFHLFTYRRSATMDLIDAVSAEINVTSVVKLSLSDLFRRTYSSITDVLDSLFRSDLKKAPTKEETKKHHLKMARLLAEECPLPQKNGFALFVIDCTANPRIYADKVSDSNLSMGKAKSISRLKTPFTSTTGLWPNYPGNWNGKRNPIKQKSS